MCEMARVYSCVMRKARRAHRCCECRGTIEPGEIYHYHKGIWDDGPASYKVCYDCEKLRKDLDNGVKYEDVTPFEGLWDSVDGASADNPAVARMWIAILEKRGQEVPVWLEQRGQL